MVSSALAPKPSGRCRSRRSRRIDAAAGVASERAFKTDDVSAPSAALACPWIERGETAQGSNTARALPTVMYHLGKSSPPKDQADSRTVRILRLASGGHLAGSLWREGAFVSTIGVSIVNQGVHREPLAGH